MESSDSNLTFGEELNQSTIMELSKDEINQVKARMAAVTQNLSATHLTHVDKKAPVLSTGPELPEWINNRPHLSLNYVLTEEQEIVAPLGEVDITTQEHQLIDDLLYLMIGCRGTYISVSYDIVNVPHFKVDSSVEPSLRALVYRILPVCSSYSIVTSFVESCDQRNKGSICEALAAAMRNLIKDYMLLVCQLEFRHMKGGLTLQTFWFYVEKTLTMLEVVSCMVSSIQKANINGGALLSLLHERTFALSGCGTIQEVLSFLCQAASVPYMKMLSLWLYRGIIKDPHSEFMVVDEVPKNKSENTGFFSVESEFSDDYWEKRYVTNFDNIPIFLKSQAQMILRTGKYLNVIREADPSISCPYHEDLNYKFKETSYVEEIEKTYHFASNRLLRLLLKEKDLMGRLRSMKHYFLLDQGDFVVQLLNLCESELTKNIDDVVPTRLEALLDMALRTSAASAHAYNDDVHCTLLPFSLMSQMMQIMSIETEDEFEYRNPPERLMLTGLEGFSLTYNVRWPLSLVIDEKSHFCYQMIFRHLFYCKYVEGLLCRVWKSNKMAKTYSVETSAHYRQGFTLRQRMLHFIQNMEYYMNFEVIERNWSIFISKMQKVENVDEVLTLHTDFLGSCMHDCMLSSPHLLKIFTKITGICVSFAHFILSDSRNVTSYPVESESFEQTVSKFDLQFTGMLVTLVDKISTLGKENYNESLIHILYRLDFNNFYSKKENNISTSSAAQLI